ncbi:MAG: UDP-N-acetylmuramate dehydrogenase [Flavobacteriaceae bacterium]|nr:UDP-N-acetylmuramate dehydrogenase [Flavobacteriaceae bacterium]
MSTEKNISLKAYNTFGIDVRAKEFISVNTRSELKEIVSKSEDFFILSGGSNLLLTRDIDKLVIHLNLKGKEVLKENERSVYVKVQAGENWHEFVVWCLEHDFGGVENLSLIPGNVGTAPMQNIGAYGVELKDFMHELEALEIQSGKIVTFKNKDCQFGYRDSIFKNHAKGKYIITSVTYKLTKHNHKLNTSYGAIQSELERNGVKNPTIKDISKAVIAIRQSKLPDPREIGNSGSFFKNPVISKHQFRQLQHKHPKVPYYIVSETEVKVPAGWLVEQCGFKGRRWGDAGVHKKQALVLVNYGNATGLQIFELSQKIQKEVKERFQIDLEAEVNII